MPYQFGLPETLESYKAELKQTLYIGNPARITNVSKLATEQCVDVQPLIDYDDPEDGRIIQHPEIKNLFVKYPSGGGGVLTFPLQVGDIVWISNSSTPLGEWLNTDGTKGVAPRDRRIKNFKDAIVDLGMGTFKNNNNPSTEHVELKYKGATVRITKDGDVEIIAKKISYIAEDDLNLSGKNVNIDSQSLKHNGKNIGDNHVHSGITSGPSNTGVPV